MKPDKLKAWLIARPSGARRLQLLHDSGVGSLTAVQSWSLEDIQAMDSATDPAALMDAIDTSAIEHATGTGEPQKYSLQFQSNNGNALKTAVHRASPELDEDGKPVVAANETAFNAQKMFSDMLGHIERQQKTMISLSTGALLAYEKALAMLIKQNEILNARVNALPEPVVPELTATNEEVMRLKAVALSKLVEMGPHVLALAMQAIARHAGVLPEAASQATEAMTNGVGSA